MTTIPDATGTGTTTRPPAAGNALGVFEWQRLVRELDLPAAVNNVASWLLSYADADGTNAFPGRGHLERATGLNRETISRALRALEAAGLAARVSHGGGRGNDGLAAEYVLTSPGRPQAEVERAARDAFPKKRVPTATCNSGDTSCPGQPVTDPGGDKEVALSRKEVAASAKEVAASAKEVADGNPTTPLPVHDHAYHHPDDATRRKPVPVGEARGPSATKTDLPVPPRTEQDPAPIPDGDHEPAEPGRAGPGLRQRLDKILAGRAAGGIDQNQATTGNQDPGRGRDWMKEDPGVYERCDLAAALEDKARRTLDGLGLDGADRDARWAQVETIIAQVRGGTLPGGQARGLIGDLTAAGRPPLTLVTDPFAPELAATGTPW
jgi:hypothetical protein